jgi:hypothetical protein
MWSYLYCYDPSHIPHKKTWHYVQIYEEYKEVRLWCIECAYTTLHAEDWLNGYVVYGAIPFWAY